jgi:hypothetical protein
MSRSLFDVRRMVASLLGYGSATVRKRPHVNAVTSNTMTKYGRSSCPDSADLRERRWAECGARLRLATRLNRLAGGVQSEGES